MDLHAVSAFAGGLASVGNIFLFCFIGSFATEQFACYAHTTYKSQWYKFPIRLQAYVRLIIANAQRPRSFNGLGIFDLNLTLFTQARKNGKLVDSDWQTLLLYTYLCVSDNASVVELFFDVPNFVKRTGCDEDLPEYILTNSHR